MINIAASIAFSIATWFASIWAMKKYLKSPLSYWSVLWTVLLIGAVFGIIRYIAYSVLNLRTETEMLAADIQGGADV